MHNNDSEGRTSRMSRFKLTTLSALVSIVGALASACSSSQSATPADQSSSSTKPALSSKGSPEFLAPGLWGEMKPIVSVKELMRDLIDPIADNIFESVKTTTTAKGIEETMPRTDEDWDRIRVGAVAMAEAGYLLKVRRPFAPPGDLNNSTGPDASELSPDQIMAKVETDPVEWNARIEALRNVGLQVIDIVKRKDVQELWDASLNLDQACEGCHRSYWYPGETPEYWQDLDRRLEDHRGELASPKGAPTKK